MLWQVLMLNAASQCLVHLATYIAAIQSLSGKKRLFPNTFQLLSEVSSCSGSWWEFLHQSSLIPLLPSLPLLLWHCDYYHSVNQDSTLKGCFVSGEKAVAAVSLIETRPKRRYHGRNIIIYVFCHKKKLI